MITISRHLLVAGLAALSVNLCSSAFALEPMQDEELAGNSGQALFTLTNIAPGQNGNPNAGIGFYRLGLDAVAELNANIDRVQLGCGGVNGDGACDIDISKLRLTGTAPVNGSYANSDAQFKNPFIELAIKNPSGLATREMVGVRFGAAETLALLSAGFNPSTTNLSDDTGINRLTGDLQLYVSNARLSNISVGGLLPVTASIREPYVTPLLFSRNTTFSLPKMIFDARIQLPLLGLVPLALTNVNLNNEPLQSVHNIYIAQYDNNGANSIPTKDFYLSLQKQNISWQKLSTGKFDGATAKTGWWVSIPQIQVKDMVINQRVDVPLLSALGGIVLSTPVNISPIDLALIPVSNCFGGRQFC